MTSPSRESSVDVARCAADLVRLLTTWGAADEATVRRIMEPLVKNAEPEEVGALIERLETTGEDWRYYPPDPLGRRIVRAALDMVMAEGSVMENANALVTARTASVVLPGNHLSFVDMNVLDALMAHTPYADVADRMTVIAGPKVYDHPIRRLASLSFGTLKTAQSQRRASGAAVMSPREVARISASTLEVVRKQRQKNTPVAIFVEGSRSRSGAMQRTLPAVSRYFEGDDIRVIPWGITGTERLVPLGENHVYPRRVTVVLGREVLASELRERCRSNRTLITDTVGFLVADLLPQPYRGVYGDPVPALEEARAIASRLGGR